LKLKVRDMEKTLQRFQTNFLKASSAQIMLAELAKVAEGKPCSEDWSKKSE
jgi:hypothetical protein